MDLCEFQDSQSNTKIPCIKTNKQTNKQTNDQRYELSETDARLVHLMGGNGQSHPFFWKEITLSGYFLVFLCATLRIFFSNSGKNLDSSSTWEVKDHELKRHPSKQTTQMDQ